MAEGRGCRASRLRRAVMAEGRGCRASVWSTIEWGTDRGTEWGTDWCTDCDTDWGRMGRAQCFTPSYGQWAEPRVPVECSYVRLSGSSRGADPRGQIRGRRAERDEPRVTSRGIRY